MRHIWNKSEHMVNLSFGQRMVYVMYLNVVLLSYIVSYYHI